MIKWLKNMWLALVNWSITGSLEDLEPVNGVISTGWKFLQWSKGA